MYRYFINTVQQFLGGGLVLWIVLALIVIAFLIFSSTLWLRKIEKLRKEGTRWSLLLVLLTNFLELILTLGIVGFLAVAFRVQAGTFSEKHGQVTQRNYEMVKTKWGIPHEQRDLSVRHYTMQMQIVETRADGSTYEYFLEEFEQPIDIQEEKIISDEVVAKLTPKEAQERPWEVVRRIKKKIRRQVYQDSIASADINIALKSNPRQLGGAFYAGYDDQWKLQYEIENKASYPTQTVFRFPLPGSGYGLYDRIFVKVDGQDLMSSVSYSEGSLNWHLPMKPNAKVDINVGYNSRGLEYFRYIIRDMRQRCKVSLEVEGVPVTKLDFPIGSMPPMEDLKKISGSSYTLNWDLSRAVTNLDIGIIVPTESQPGYHIAKILRSAPIGLAIMILLIVVTRWLLNRRFLLLPVTLSAIAFFMSFALLANINEVLSFPLAFLLSTLPMTAIVLLFWLILDKHAFTAIQTSALFALFTIGYPLAVLSENVSGTIIYIGYSILLGYVMILVVFNRIGKYKTPEQQ